MKKMTKVLICKKKQEYLIYDLTRCGRASLLFMAESITKCTVETFCAAFDTLATTPLMANLDVSYTTSVMVVMVRLFRIEDSFQYIPLSLPLTTQGQQGQYLFALP